MASEFEDMAELRQRVSSIFHSVIYLYLSFNVSFSDCTEVTLATPLSNLTKGALPESRTSSAKIRVYHGSI